MVEEPLADCGRRNEASIAVAHEPVAMACDEIVNRVANHARHERPERRRDRPGAPDIPRDTQSRCRSDEHTLAPTAVVSRRLDPDHRVDARHLRMSRAHGAADVALERGEPQRVPALVLEDELDAGGAQPAAAVVEQQRRLIA